MSIKILKLFLFFIFVKSHIVLATSLKCEHIYLDIDTSSSIVKFTTSGGTDIGRLTSDAYFHKFKLKFDFMDELAEYSLDRRTLILKTYNKYFDDGTGSNGWAKYQCNIIKTDRLI